MTTSVSRRLNVLWIMFKIISFFIIALFAQLYVRVGIILTCGKHLHDRITAVRWEVCTHKTGLTPPFSLRCMKQARKVNVMYLCVIVSVLPLSTILIFDFKPVPTEWYLLFFTSLANKLLFLPVSRALTINIRSMKHIMHYNRICNYSLTFPCGHLYYAVTCS